MINEKTLDTEKKNFFAGLALALDSTDYEDKKHLLNILSNIKNDTDSEEVVKYLLNSTKTNYRLGLVYSEWAMNGFKTIELQGKEEIRIYIQLVGGLGLENE